MRGVSHDNGEVASVFLDYVTIKSQVAAGKVRLLAVTGTQRSPITPAVPTLAELGYPGIEASTWAGLFVPGKTPREVVQRLEAAVRKIVVDPDYLTRIRELGYEPGGLPQAQFVVIAVARKIVPYSFGWAPQNHAHLQAYF